MDKDVHMVTGAFGYSGKYITKRLINEGHHIRTLTNSVNRTNPFGEKVKAVPFNFDNPEKLIDSLRGTSVLYNTYWVRFNHSDFTHSLAVNNTLKLFDAAKKAGVERIIHVSITNPSRGSHLEYFKGKAILECALMNSGIPYTILRPAVLFGKEDILINNIAWFLRKFPVFGVFGDGNYRLQPTYVDDLAKLAIDYGRKTENEIVDAIGPETFTYRDLVKEIGISIGKQKPIISIPPRIGHFVGSAVGKIVRDTVITREEIDGLMSDLLCTDSSPAGWTKLSTWLRENSSSVGIRYSGELHRRKNRMESYDNI